MWVVVLLLMIATVVLILVGITMMLAEVVAVGIVVGLLALFALLFT